MKGRVEAEHLSDPIHLSDLELRASRRTKPIEAGVRNGTGIEVGED
jgi:hypothetical protein